MTFLNRDFNCPKQSFFLFGPRGTGKSTLIKTQYPDALWLDFLQPALERLYIAKPERLHDLLAAHPNNQTIVIDEVQRVPSILTVVHSLIEKQKNLQFVLAGSNSRKLKRSGADLLAGRALKCILHPFIAAELKNNFNLKQALHYGLLPLVWQTNNPAKTLQTYLTLYLKEEIQLEGWVRNLEHFTRFLEAISFSHGSLLNVSKVAQACEVKRKTVEGYISIIEDLLLAYQLPVFTKRAKRHLITHPKFYLFDAGVFQTLRPRGPLDQPEEIEGIALEGLIMQHLKAWNDYNFVKHALGFWRTRSGLEVDFIVYGPKVFWAVEVKNSQRIYSKDIKPLQAFLSDYPMAKAILIYRGKETIMQKQVLCLPCTTFLKSLIPGKFPDFLS